MIPSAVTSKMMSKPPLTTDERNKVWNSIHVSVGQKIFPCLKKISSGTIENFWTNRRCNSSNNAVNQDTEDADMADNFVEKAPIKASASQSLYGKLSTAVEQMFGSGSGAVADAAKSDESVRNKEERDKIVVKIAKTDSFRHIRNSTKDGKLVDRIETRGDEPDALVSLEYYGDVESEPDKERGKLKAQPGINVQVVDGMEVDPEQMQRNFERYTQRKEQRKHERIEKEKVKEEMKNQMQAHMKDGIGPSKRKKLNPANEDGEVDGAQELVSLEYYFSTTSTQK